MKSPTCHRISQYGTMAMAISHRPARNVRRTSRTALKRCPSAVAIIGADAVISPSRKMLKVKVRLSASVAAASCVAPTRPISRMSVAWIVCCVRLASISGHASANVARSSSCRRPLLGRGEILAAASMPSRLAARAPVEKVWPRASSCASECRLCIEVVAMKFVRAVWKLLVGIKDGLVLILLLLFFAGLYGVLSTRQPAVGEGVLDLNLNGDVVEQPARAQWSEVANGSARRQYRLRDLIAALDQAKDDDRVKAVALDLDGFSGGGQTAMGDLADAVRRVRSAGKPVVAYAVGYTNDTYQLASAASEIWLNPLGAVAIAGPGRSNLYFKGLLDKLGVTANVYRVGTYKSAVEPFIRNDMSPEARQNYMALDGAELESWRQGVHQARPKANVDAMLKDMNGAIAAAGGDMAKAALATGLIDRIGDRTAFEARLAQLGGSKTNEPGGYSRIRLASYIADKVDQKPRGPIGIVTIAGTIVDGKAAPGSAGGDTIAKQIEDGIRNKGVKALVVRVDSPGGSVLASERIRQALLEAKSKRIPIVVSMGSVAASRGTWVPTPA